MSGSRERSSMATKAPSATALAAIRPSTAGDDQPHAPDWMIPTISIASPAVSARAPPRSTCRLASSSRDSGSSA